MCSATVNSVILNSRPENMATFHWSQLEEELKKNTPLLWNILITCTKRRRNSSTCTPSNVPCVCAAVLLNCHNSRMSLVHKIISCILYAGHSYKQVLLAWKHTGYILIMNLINTLVYTRLHALGLCMSYRQAYRSITSLGNTHNLKMKKWMKDIISDRRPGVCILIKCFILISLNKQLFITYLAYFTRIITIKLWWCTLQQ